MEKVILDSSFKKDILSSELAESVYDKVMKEVEFQDMFIQKKKLCRPGAFQAFIREDGTYPLLRCPSEKGLIVKQFTPTIQLIRDHLAELTGVNLNHVKIQIYTNEKSFIQPHTDKTLDLNPNTAIVNFRIGSTREFRITNKTNNHEISTPMVHNSVFVLGPKTNLEWMHSVKKSTEPVGASISMVFRSVGTFIRPDGFIFGVGSRFKEEDEISNIESVLNGEEFRMKLVKGFSLENKSSTNCRNEVYEEVIENTISLNLNST